MGRFRIRWDAVSATRKSGNQAASRTLLHPRRPRVMRREAGRFVIALGSVRYASHASCHFTLACETTLSHTRCQFSRA